MASVPVTRTSVAGEVYTAAYLNDNFRDPLNWLLASARCQLYQAGAAQSIANNAFTAVTFDTEYVDSSGMHSTVSNTSRATAVYPGWYWVFVLGSTTGNATGSRGEHIRVNGTALNGMVTSRPSNANPTTGSVAGLVYLNVGDYVELAVYQNSGGALAMGNAGGLIPSLSVSWSSN